MNLELKRGTMMRKLKGQSKKKKPLWAFMMTRKAKVLSHKTKLHSIKVVMSYIEPLNSKDRTRLLTRVLNKRLLTLPA